MVIGLAVTREGISVQCWVWPGNTAHVPKARAVDTMPAKSKDSKTTESPHYPPERMICSILRSVSALIVKDGFTVPVLPGTAAPSITYRPRYPHTRP